MLINADEIISATILSEMGLEKLLIESGYTVTGIKSATFLGMTDYSTFIHKITYEGTDGQDETNEVYVSYLETEDGTRVRRAKI